MSTKASLLPEATVEVAPAPLPIEDAATLRDAFVEQRPALLLKARQLTRNEEEAQDLVQDTLLRAMNALHRFTPGTNARAWLVRILSNLFIDRCRQRACRPALVPVPENLAVDDGLEADVPPLSARVSLEQLREALTKLEPQFREVYELRITKNRSYEQIAEQLAIPVATVATRLFRARQRLCKLLMPLIDRPGY